MSPIEVGFEFTGQESAKDLSLTLIRLIASIKETGESMNSLASTDIEARLSLYQKALDAIYITTTKTNQGTKEGIDVLLGIRASLESLIPAYQNVLSLRQKFLLSDEALQKQLKITQKEVEKNAQQLQYYQNKLADGHARTAAEIKNLNTKIDAYTTSLSRTRTELENLNIVMKENKNVVQAESTAISAMRELATELNADLENMSEYQRLNSAEGRKLLSDIQALNVVINNYDNSLTGSNTQLGLMTANTAKLEAVTNKLKFANEGNTTSLEAENIALKQTNESIVLSIKSEDNVIKKSVANLYIKRKIRDNEKAMLAEMTGDRQKQIEKEEAIAAKMKQRKADEELQNEALANSYAKSAEAQEKANLQAKIRLSRFTEESSSIQALDAQIKQLVEDYSKLSKSEEQSQTGVDIQERLILLRAEYAERVKIRDTTLQSIRKEQDALAKREAAMQKQIEKEEAIAAKMKQRKADEELQNEALANSYAKSAEAQEKANLQAKIRLSRFTEESSSIQALDAQIKQLVEDYSKLSKSEEQSQTGVDIQERLILLRAEYAERVKIRDTTLQSIRKEQDALAKREAAMQKQIEKVRSESTSIMALRAELAQLIDERSRLSAEERKGDTARLERINQIKIQILEEKELEKASLGAAMKAEDVGVKAEKAGKAATWSWENFQNVFDRMGVRMIASMIWWTAIIGAATALWEWWTKVDDATQRALDRMKEYKDGIQSLMKTIEESPERIKSEQLFNKDELETQINIMKNNPAGDINKATGKAFTYDLDQRYLAYEKIKSIASNVLDEVNKEDFSRYLAGERIQKNLAGLQRYADLQVQISHNTAIQKDLQKEVDENERLQQLERVKIAKQLPLISKKLKSKIEENKVSEEDFEENKAYFLDIAKKHPGSIVRSEEDVTNFIAGKEVNIGKPGMSDREVIRNLDYEDVLSVVRKDYRKLKDEHEFKKKVLQAYKSLNREDEDEIASLQGKTKNKKSPKLKSKEWDIESDIHKEMMEQNQAVYDSTEKSTNDIMGLYDINDDEAKLHFDRQMAIIKDYRDKKIKTEEELVKMEMDANLEKQKINEDSKNGRREALDDLEKYNLKLFKTIDDTNRKIAETNKKAQDKLDEYNKQGLKNKLAEDKAGRWNPFSAFFGAGGGTPIKDWKDKKKEMRALVESDDIELSRSTAADNNALDRQEAAKKKLDPQDLIDLKTHSPQQMAEDKEQNFHYTKKQKEQYQKDAQEYLDASKEVESANNDLHSKQTQKQKDASDETIALKQKEKEKKIAIAVQLFDATQKIASAEFDLQKKRIQQAMADVQGLANYEMILAGNNSGAKQRIAMKEHGEMLALKRKEAELTKEQGVFNVLISTAQGISGAWKTGDPITGAIIASIVAGIGATEIAAITATPLPKYAKGRRGGKKERALLNEEGFEIVENDGKYKMYNDGKIGIANLESGDTVHTHRDSVKLMEKDSYLKDLLRGTGVYIQNKDNERNIMFKSIANHMITEKGMERAFKNALKELPQQKEVTLPAQSVQDRHIRQQLRHGL